MSEITIINETDKIGDSRAVINTNFSNLNAGKVEVEAGKGLSANDLTDALKAKLDYISVTQDVDLDTMESDIATKITEAEAKTIKLDDFATPDDNTDLNASTSRHGLLPKLGGGTTNFLRADGTWAEPPGGGGGSVGGVYGLNIEYLTANKTLIANTNKLLQHLDGNSNKSIYLKADQGAVLGDRFYIRNTSSARTFPITSLTGSTPTLITSLVAGDSLWFVYDGTNWIEL